MISWSRLRLLQNNTIATKWINEKGVNLKVNTSNHTP